MLHVEARYDDTEAIVIIDGKFDLAGLARFWGYVSAVLAPHPHVGAVTFIDSAGLRALERARKAAAEAGVAFRIRGPSPEFRRIAELCGLEGLLLSG